MTQHETQQAPLLVPVVYTMGKVGSTSISSSILETGRLCFDIHTLCKDYLLAEMSRALEKNKFPVRHCSISMAYRNHLFTHTKKCLYISLVREPIGRNLSAYFQNLDHYEPGEDPDKTVESRFKNFVDTYPHRVPLSWFDMEFNEQLKIDVYSQPFDKEAKYAYLPRHNTVIFRVDCPNATKSEVLSAFLVG